MERDHGLYLTAQGRVRLAAILAIVVMFELPTAASVSANPAFNGLKSTPQVGAKVRNLAASTTVLVPNYANATAGAAPPHPNSELSSGIDASPGTLPPPSQEIPALRTASSDTYSVSAGYELISYSGPINYRDGSGSWQPIDDSLIKSNAIGFAWQNKANSFSLLLPSTLGAGPVEFQDASGSVTFKLNGAGGAPGQVSGSTVTYLNAVPGVTVQITAGNAGIKESVILTGSASPSQLNYSMVLSSGMNAVASPSGAVDITTQSGNFVYSIDAPSASDAAGAMAASVRMLMSGSGASRTVSLAVDSAWLANPGRQWPVTIDPSISYNADQACEIQNGSHANTNYCGSGTYLKVGHDPGDGYLHRSVMLFNIQNSVPVGAQVTRAGLAVYLNSTSTLNYGSVSAYQLTQSWTTAVTWNDYNGSTAWTNAGGTFNSTVLASQTPSTSGWYYWHSAGISSMAQSWLNHPSSNDGIILTADSETNNEVDTFGSGRVGSAPYFYVYYVDAIGQHPTYTMVSHQLTDRSTLGVNVANGNLMLQATDLSVKGTGLNLTLSRVYNSLGQGGAFGTWLMTPGIDETLSFYDSADVMFQGPSGYAVTFFASGSAYTPAAGVDASLVKNADGTYTLTYNSSAEQLKFNSSGVLTSDVDRRGDTITITTSSGDVTSISDTQSRSVSLSYNSPVATNLVSGISDSTSRSWGYTYQSANGFHELTQYTDPNSKSTQYTYDISGRLTQITDPVSNQTKFAYDSSSRVTSITYVTDTVHGTGPTTTLSYQSASGSCAAAPAGDSIAGYTTVTDANSNATTYCFDPEGLVLQVIDPLTNSQKSAFSSDQHVTSSTDALSQSTTNTFNSNNDLTQSTAPVLGSGQNAPTFSAVFNTPSTVTGYKFLPSSVTDPQGNCTAYVYDTAGQLTDTYEGQASGCDGKTAGTHLAARYQGDPGISCGGKTGQVCSTTSGNGGTTSYGFDANGNLTSVTPPSPLGATTITVDSLSRMSTVTDGKGQKATYSYDGLDRMTQVLYNGASQCVPSNGNCITYGYDADGNRTSMVDQSGTTSYYYDALNRLTTESLPSTGYVCAGSSPSGLTYSYDGVGNILGSCDSGGTTTYVYDKDNRLSSIAEPGGSCGSTPSLCTTFGYNSDGNRNSITFPGGATQTTTFDNDQNVSSVTGKSSTNSVLTSFTYTYVNGANDATLVQTATENDAVAANTDTYSYDALNRLTRASVTAGSGTSYSYSYDSDGNMVSKTAGSTTTSYGYNAADQLCWAYTGSSSNACSSPPTGSTTYSFDSNGNETGSSAGGSFTYNAKNQTTAITYSGTTLSPLAYTDGGQQQRITAGSTGFTNEAGGIGISTSGSSSTYYLLDPGGSVLGERIGSNHYYFLTDRLGSIVTVISGDGQTVSNRYGYDPYGNPTYHSGSVSNPWGYVGGFTDPTGLIKFGARYYDPATARWTQVDPAGQGPNLYQYVAADPINSTDPTGTFCCFGQWHRWAWWGAYGQLWFHISGWDSQVIMFIWTYWGAIIGAAVGAAAGFAIGGPWGAAAGVLLGGIVGFVLIVWLLWLLYVNLVDNWAGAWVVISYSVTWWGSYGWSGYFATSPGFCSMWCG